MRESERIAPCVLAKIGDKATKNQLNVSSSAIHDLSLKNKLLRNAFGDRLNIVGFGKLFFTFESYKPL